MEIAPVPTCSPPTDLAVGATTETTADISWTAGGSESSWNVSWGAPGYTPGDADEIGTATVSTTSYQITNLSSGTNYDFYVQADCGGGDESSFSIAESFATVCEPTTVPYTEDFESANAPALPLCVLSENVGMGNDWVTGYVNGGLPAFDSELIAYVADPDNAADAWFFTRAIELDQGVDYQISYRYSGGSSTKTEKLKVSYGTSAQASAMTTELANYPAITSTTEMTPTVYFTVPADGVYYFGFNAYSDADQNLIVIDDINVDLKPACLAPTALTVDAVTQNTADISWTAGGSESSWNVSWGALGYTPGGTDEVGTATVTTTSYQITNLTAGTEYDVYVQADCGGDQSTFTGPESLFTLPANDDLCDATALTVGATSAGDAYTNVGATKQTDEPNGTCWGGTSNDDGTVWFSFMAPNTGNVTVTTDIPGGSLTDTHITIYEAPGDCSDLTTLGAEVGCDEDGGDTVGFGYTSVASMTGLTAGNTYYIQVGGYASAQGSFGIEVKDDGYIYVDDTEGWSPMAPAGNATASDNITVMEGTATFGQDIEVNDVTVMSGATLNVESVLTINGNITSDGDMVFKSTATSDGELAAVPSSSTITGNVTVERYMADHRSFRFVSPAVTTTSSIHANWQEGASSVTDAPNPGFGTHITGTYTTDQEDGFDITASGSPSLFTLNAVTQSFDAIGNTDVNTLEAGKGYFIYVRGDRTIDLTSNTSHSPTTLRATGTLQTGPMTKSLGNLPNGNFVAVANPYQSSVDVNDVISGSSNLNGNFAYVYDPSLGGGNGAYATVVLPSGTSLGSSNANNYIQPGQAVQMTSSGGSVDIVFAEADKAPGNHTTTFSNEDPFTDNVHINGHLFTAANYAAGESMQDNFSLLFSQDFDNALNNEDAVKPMNFAENMGIGTPDQAYSIEKREMPVENEDIALFNTGYANQDYTLVLEVSAFENATPYLVDSYTGEQTELQAGENVISFSVDQNLAGSTVFNRFHIHFGPSTLSVGSQQADYGITLYPNPAQSGAAFYLTAGQFEGQSVKVGITDLLGKTVYSTTQQFNGGRIAIQPDSPLGSGVYFVRLSQDGKTVNKRLVVK